MTLFCPPEKNRKIFRFFCNSTVWNTVPLNLEKCRKKNFRGCNKISENCHRGYPSISTILRGVRARNSPGAGNFPRRNFDKNFLFFRQKSGHRCVVHQKWKNFVEKFCDKKNDKFQNCVTRRHPVFWLFYGGSATNFSPEKKKIPRKKWPNFDDFFAPKSICSNSVRWWKFCHFLSPRFFKKKKFSFFCQKNGFFFNTRTCWKMHFFADEMSKIGPFFGSIFSKKNRQVPIAKNMFLWLLFFQKRQPCGVSTLYGALGGGRGRWVLRRIKFFIKFFCEKCPSKWGAHSGQKKVSCIGYLWNSR